MTDRNDKPTGDLVRVPSEVLGLPVPADAPRVDYVVTAADGESFKLEAPSGDARTVLPGQPVMYHQPADLAAIESGGGWYGLFGGPIPSEPPDPTKIVGVCDPSVSPPDPLPIPPAGFYWARLDGADRWEPVEVHGTAIASFGNGLHSSDVVEWGPALYPPGVAASASRLTYVEAQKLKGALGAALLPAPFGGEPEVSRKVTGKEHAELVAAIARCTIQPAECRHDAWEFPMHWCPTCGTEGR